MTDTKTQLFKFGTLCRGNGKIYVYVEIAFSKGQSLNSFSTADNGEALPAKIQALDTRDDGFVLIVPLLSIDQTATVQILDDEQSVIAESQISIKAESAKWKSKAGTALRDPLIPIIRNCDEELGPLGTNIAIESVIDSYESSEIVHGTISTMGESIENLAGQIGFAFFDDAGEDIALDDWCCLCDTTGALDDYPGVFKRIIRFSMRKKTHNSFFIWAKSNVFGNGNEFVFFDDRVVQEKRDWWYQRTLIAEADPNYERWFLERRANSCKLDAQSGRTFSVSPVFSIIVPLYNTPIEYFESMIDSVLAQSYGRFELILVNASPENNALSQAVASRAEADARITTLELNENLGITENTNKGIGIATGDFLCFLDHDDVIEADLLYRYVDGINKYPETDLLYCDEDKLSDSHYCSPYFKPDWDPYLLCSQNYVCHMLTVRRSIVAQFDLPSAEFDGAQDHNLTLRVSEEARNVYHVRRVMYHWRIHPGSTANDSDAKPYASEAGVRSIQAHLDRCGIRGTASPSGIIPFTYHIDYALAEHPLVSIIIPNKNMASVLRRCIDSIINKSTYDNFEIVIVENNSDEESIFSSYLEMEDSDSRIRVIDASDDAGFNYSRLINVGASNARGEYLITLNNDIEVITEDWIERLLGICTQDGVGVVGPKLLYPDGLMQHTGVLFDRGRPLHVNYLLDGRSTDHFASPQLTQNYSAVTGACSMTAKAMFESVGGYDEEYKVDYSDVDYCLKLRERGLLVVYEPMVELYHYESMSRGFHETINKKTLFCEDDGILHKKWPEYFVKGDPYSNPNLQPSYFYHRLYLEAEKDD